MVLVYTLTSVLSAFLVFFIQPVVAKLALPVLGGTPAVWNGCMVFFQMMLLLGYIYAHLIGRQRSLKLQFGVHILLLLLVLSLFPLYFNAQGSSIDATTHPLGWLLVTLLYTVGLPFFVISSTSPLLQKWFAQTNHPSADNPYFLYSASNIGSMVALLSYPVVIEPFITLVEQLQSWQIAIAVLTVLFVGVMVVTQRNQRNSAAPQKQRADRHIDRSEVTMKRRLTWVVLAFIPSSLLYAITTYITTDLFSAPMLWLLPLALYLLTFIFMFESNLRGFKLADRMHQPMVFFAVFLVAVAGAQPPIYFIAHVLAFFCVAMYLHGRLSQSKPGHENLTEFFLFMSLGGVLGGLFNTFVAPQLFSSIVEYPAMLLLSVILRQPLAEGLQDIRRSLGKIMIFVMLLGVAYALWSLFDVGTGSFFGNEEGGKIAAIAIRVFIMFIVFVYAVRYTKRPAVWAFGLGVIALAGNLLFNYIGMGKLLLQERGVFGVHRIYYVENQANILMHGTTMHGVQLQDKQITYTPVSYYYALHDVFDTLPNPSAPVAVMGLGAGSVACYGKSGQQMDFYEIDPLVIEIAQNPDYFTFLSDCAAENTLILGDARQQIAKQPNGKYGLIVADTFSSDSIPMHMMTEEAVQSYVDKLLPNGLLAFHVSNRNIELRPVLSAIAEKLELVAVARGLLNEKVDNPMVESWVAPSSWVVMAKKSEDLQGLKALGKQWETMPKAYNEAVWTDNFSNVFLSLQPVRVLRGTTFGAVPAHP